MVFIQLHNSCLKSADIQNRYGAVVCRELSYYQQQGRTAPSKTHKGLGDIMPPQKDIMSTSLLSAPGGRF